MKLDLNRNKCLSLLGVGVVGFLSLVFTTQAQHNRLVKLVMRLGEERVLEDGTRVAINKGDGDLIVVTLSRNAPSLTTNARSTYGRLRLGTYKGAATEASTTGTIRITIKSIDEDGTVKADIRASNGLYGEGSLTGTIDARGELRLKGEVVTTLFAITRWRFSLVAEAEDDALTKGRYSFEAIGTGTDGRGEFYRLQLEKDL